MPRVFLSRLYGGEHAIEFTYMLSQFLSRLYGGEREKETFSMNFKFLSRLYGGELTGALLFILV